MKLADKIKINLMRSVSRSTTDLLIPNFFINTHYEMDLFKMTKSGIVTEFEIKISRSDFKNDFKKGTLDYFGNNTGNSKHDEIKNGERICNYFYFVVPENLVKIEEIPLHCGLIYFNKYERFDYIKIAPKLHKNKFLNYNLLCEKLTYRCNILQMKLRNYKNIISDLKKKLNDKQNSINLKK